MTIKITPNQFLALAKKAYSIDMVYILLLLKDDIDIEPLLESARIKNIVSGLTRKGLITEKGITITGKMLLTYMETEEGTLLKKKKPVIGTFENWWKAYPGTDTFKYKGKSFEGSRSLRVNKEKCKDKFLSILNEGEYSAKMLIDAMLFDVTQKKEVSLKKKENKLTYMQNSLTYLNQRSYEPFIELIESGKEILVTKKAKEIDI